MNRMDEPSVVMTPDIAHAVLDMADHGFSKGLGPETEEATEAWTHLVSLAELRVQRRARLKSNNMMKKPKINWQSRYYELAIAIVDANVALTCGNQERANSGLRYASSLYYENYKLDHMINSEVEPDERED